jgi:hypothetical protein
VILFLAANPRETDRLALDREARAIHVELKRSGPGGGAARRPRRRRWVVDLLRHPLGDRGGGGAGGGRPGNERSDLDPAGAVERLAGRGGGGAGRGPAARGRQRRRP